MLWLDMTYMMKLKQLGIELEMYTRYVDDGNMVVEALEPGTRFENGKLSIHEEDVQEDAEIPDAERTTKDVLKIVFYQ